ncbi:MAG: hypothetical protein LUQ50_03890 [Methanospirillum sp.]|uniref:hypothetical protein n=1 Tax=Methanospirillum sp. TaxID=45200 RepID=UPI00236E0A11|nr:hypothetical protein [Methanospirillum sp.]MDD1728196.1 hypothetical protein [Methanospirillum sp.]
MAIPKKEDSNQKFRDALLHRWTDGRSPIEQRISIFSHIRDIPYAIVPEWLDSDDIIRMMITENRGWCGPKHQLLFWMFERLGIRIRPVYIPFRWQDQPVRYPDSFRTYFSVLPPTNHLFCEVDLGGGWQVLDATWDPPLRHAGFPVNEPWNGISGTIPAVTRVTQGEVSGSVQPSRDRPMKRIGFVSHLNRWLSEVRTDSNNQESE